MKYYLIFLLFIIMGAGARTMFEIAYHGAGREHDFAPAADTARLIFLALWFALLMVADVLLISYHQLRYRIFFILVVSLAVFIPVIYQILTH